MKKIVIINGHGDPSASRANKKILESVTNAYPHSEVATLAELYPDGKIDIATEQQRLLDADIIVYEYPIWWYSHPSILHKYFEEVYTMGFAYGSAKKLAGKKVITSFTCGAGEKNYSEGASGENFKLLPLPIKATCWLCDIDYVGEVYTYGAMYYGLTTQDEVDKVDSKMALHAERLIELIESVS